jgi:hypothetical protein
MIFTKRFQYEKFDDVVQSIYEHYNAMLIMIRPKRRRRPSNRVNLADPEFRIAPFETYIREGYVCRSELFLTCMLPSFDVHLIRKGHWRCARQKCCVCITHREHVRLLE